MAENSYDHENARVYALLYTTRSIQSHVLPLCGGFVGRYVYGDSQIYYTIVIIIIDHPGKKS